MKDNDITVRLTILFLWVSGILAAGQFAKVAVTFPLFREIYPGLGPKLGFLVSAVSAMGLLFGLFAGMILSRYGFRRLLIWALMLGGALSLLQSVGLSFPVMLATRFLEGASHLVIVVAAPTLIGQIAPVAIRNASMALWGTVFAVAFALFSWLGLPFAQRFGVYALLDVHGFLLWSMALILARILPVSDRRTDHISLGLRDIISRHVAAYSSPYVAAPAMGWLFYAMSFMAIITVFPDFLPMEQRGVISGVMPLAALSVSMVLGVSLLRFLPPVSVVITGFSIAALMALSLSLGVAQREVAIVMIASLGLVQAGSFSAIPVLNSKVEDQSLANGALAQTGNIGSLIGTPLLLWLVQHLGMAGLIGFALVAFCGGASVHLWLMALRRRAL